MRPSVNKFTFAHRLLCGTDMKQKGDTCAVRNISWTLPDSVCAGSRYGHLNNCVNYPGFPRLLPSRWTATNYLLCTWFKTISPSSICYMYRIQSQSSLFAVGNIVYYKFPNGKSLSHRKHPALAEVGNSELNKLYLSHCSKMKCSLLSGMHTPHRKASAWMFCRVLFPI